MLFVCMYVRVNAVCNGGDDGDKFRESDNHLFNRGYHGTPLARG
jgi:hypothetical protein